MDLLLPFAGCLMVAVLVSEWAHRSILSTAVLFLAAGVVLGIEPFEFVSLHAGSEFVREFSELVLFAVLFTDGMLLGARELAQAWRLPGRALLLGMPLAMLLTAGSAWLILNVSWLVAFLLAAALSPTDPVFASAIVGREKVPPPLRNLLNVESGINDGLALPAVVGLLAYLTPQSPHFAALIGEVVGGIVLGVAVPWTAIRLEESRLFGASDAYRPLMALAIGLLLLALSRALQVNSFLAAFAGGVTVATLGHKIRQAFYAFGELLAELLKLAAVMVFGVLISMEYLRQTSWSDVLFVVVVLFLVRPVALTVSLIRSPLGWRERAVAGWFGPKGFASITYGLLIVQRQPQNSELIFHWIALVVLVSITLHSSTDVLLAKWLVRHPPLAEGDQGPHSDKGL